MKARFPALVFLLALTGLLLSGCSGGAVISGWPGISAREDTVYLSYQGAVYAVNANTGALSWQFPKDKPDATKPFYAPAAFGPDGMVVVGNFGHTLYALGADGNELWQYSIGSGNFMASAFVTDSTILAPASDDYLYAVNLDGALVWKFKAENMLWGQPVSDGELVYLPGLDHNLYALNLQDGKEVWREDLGSALLGGPVLSEDGTLYISTLAGDGIAFDPFAKQTLWTRSTGGRIWSSPTLFDDVLYVGNDGNKIFAISAADGSILWQQDAGSPIIGGAVVWSEGVAFPKEDGNLVAWDLNGEKQLWTNSVGGKLYTTPAVVGDQLIAPVTGGDEILKAFSLSGQGSWGFTLPK